MSIWAEVKKALNSTLGTDSFKPLNEIVEMEMYTSNVGNQIDKVLAKKYVGMPITTNPRKKSIKLGLGGQANVSLCVVCSPSVSEVVEGVIKIKRSSTASTSGTYQSEFSFSFSPSGALSQCFSIYDTTNTFAAGDVITIEAYVINPPAGSRFWISDFILRGTILPKGSIQIMED